MQVIISKSESDINNCVLLESGTYHSKGDKAPISPVVRSRVTVATTLAITSQSWDLTGIHDVGLMPRAERHSHLICKLKKLRELLDKPQVIFFFPY